MASGMVGLAQMVRASDCGPEGRRFNSDIPPHIVQISTRRCFFDKRLLNNSRIWRKYV